MIVFDLRCAPSGHRFEGWFGSSDEYEAQLASGLVSCPVCGAAEIGKAPMAPAVPKKGGEGETRRLLAEMAAMQKKLLENSDHVGDRFAEEARAIHLGEAEARAIHGRADRDDAASLIEEGIPIAPLPFPVRDPGEEN